MLPSRFHLLAVLVAAIPLAARAEDFVTARGKTVEMPDIAAMTCEEIEVTLAKIDSTRYRENAPVPHDRADEPLHLYEESLAKALFKVCVVDPRSGIDPAEPQRQAGTQ